MPTATAPTSASRIDARLRSRAAQPVPAYSSAVFRILFGLLGLYGVIRFVAKGWVDTLYLQPEHHLTYEYFDWVRPWPATLMYVHLAVVGAAALAVAVGFHSRNAAALYLLGFGYLELLDGALYLNHYWWVTLAAAWLVVLPVHDTWAMSSRNPRTMVPAVTVWILRAQLAVVYLFAGLAKLNADWLLHGDPLSIWLANRSAMPIVGTWLGVPSIGLAASWAGALFDCTIVAWLLWSRSRRFAYGAVVIFHGVTGLLFQIGLFPIVMIAGTLIFFSPDWPLRVLRIPKTHAHPTEQVTSLGLSRLLALGIVAGLQVLVPLRHLAMAGDVRWTEEGYYLSWRVMLTEKTGSLRFDVTDAETGEVWRVRPESLLQDWQARQASIRSDLLLSTAHLIAQDFADRGHPGVEVRAQSFVSFNGRQRQRYVDPTVDLAALPRGSRTSEWLLPLEEPQYR